MQPSEVTTTVPGYPPPEMIREIIDAAAVSMEARTGREFTLTFAAEYGILRSVRDDGFHAAYLVPPVGPSYRRTEGERIGGEDLSPEERALLLFRFLVDDAVEAFVNGHNQRAA
ncbi:hypothetical protein [Methylorubrum zatmanii]|uniref:Uncharacterized protein n=1 Tax=Methylorubrum zatmanii TaxID=29429 RepID=A0ABW1WLZ9_9HYPH|nr:hypothetical protein [Methylorubrum zatmanii]MBD8907190.1 hypothetical protein [Methylorubrum zatmanii]